MKLLNLLLASLCLLFAACPGQAPRKAPKKDTVATLIAKLADKSPKTRKAAEAALVKKGKEAVDPLLAVLAGNYKVSSSAGLGLLGATGAASAPLLKGDDSMQAAAARILGEIGDEKAVDFLIRALEDENASKAASAALKKITGQDLGSDIAKWKEWRAGKK